MSSLILVLFGVKGSGKDTVGDILRDGFGFYKEAFARPLKEMVKLAFPTMQEEHLYGQTQLRETPYLEYPTGGICLTCNATLVDLAVGEERTDVLDCISCGTTYPKHVTPRIALQTLGTEWGRRLTPNIWVNSCFARIAKENQYTGKWTTQPKPVRVAVTDGRFRNELQRARDLEAVCVKLTRGLTESLSDHPSEAEFRSIPDAAFTAVLDNEKIALVDMPAAVEKLLSDLHVL